mgnify:CR=1 FL=1|jgi:YfiH family protein
MIKAQAMDAAPGVRHGFFTRQGGVSQGIYDSLNGGYGSSDDDLAVTENRCRAVELLGLGDAPLCTVYQCHGVDCITVTAPWSRQGSPKADAMVTDLRGIVLGVLTADCVPVFFADPEASVIGVAHAGWKGALGGVVEAVVNAMTRLGATPGNIVAAIGPCIGQKSYEVGAEFRAEFCAADRANEAYFMPASRAGYHMFDIAGYVAGHLERLGLGTVETLAFDTYADEERFFSYRRACHNSESDYGRLLSLVALEL